MLESVIAMGLTGIAVMSALYVFGAAAHSGANSERDAQVILQVQNLAEHLVSTTGADGSLEPGLHNRFFSVDGISGESGPIRIEWSVEHDTPMKNVMRITLRGLVDSTNREIIDLQLHRIRPFMNSVENESQQVDLNADIEVQLNKQRPRRNIPRSR